MSTKQPAMALKLRRMRDANHHEGTKYVRSLAQQRFWAIGLRNALCSIKFKCVRWRKLAVQPVHLLMVNSMTKEYTVTYPFKDTGVNYFDPFEVTAVRRPVKHWCWLLTCLVSRAAHIEVVSGLDTYACMMTNTRFCAKRGNPHTTISDNKTNFAGAPRDFRKILNEWKQETNCDRLTRGHIMRKFNPPGTPHYGGTREKLSTVARNPCLRIFGRKDWRCQCSQLNMFGQTDVDCQNIDVCEWRSWRPRTTYT